MEKPHSESEPHVPKSNGCQDGDGGHQCSGKSGSKPCSQDRSRSTPRRHVLAALSGAATAGLAGCVGLFEDPLADHEPPEAADSSDDVIEDEEGDTESETYNVEYLLQEETIEIAPDTNLLDAGEEQGWDLPFECRSGFCGQCLGQVDGDAHDLVEMTNNAFDPLDDAAMEEGYTLTCTGQPRADFTLETGKAGALSADEGGATEESTEEPTEETEEASDQQSYDIEFLKQDATIEVLESDNLLEAGEDQGWDLPYQCRSGFCGVCSAHVNGNGHELVEMTNNEALSDDEVEEGYVLTCTGQPRDDFKIETGESP